MSATIEALRLHGVGDMQLHSEPFPIPKNNEVIIRVSSVGICGSDLHWFGKAGIGDAQLEKPLVLGHEFSGIVDDPRSVLNGRRVAIDPAIACQARPRPSSRCSEAMSIRSLTEMTSPSKADMLGKAMSSMKRANAATA